MSLPDLYKVLSIGAAIRTPIGLLGFVFACAFVLLLVRKPAKGKATRSAAAWRPLLILSGLFSGVFLIALLIVSFSPVPHPTAPLPIPAPAPRPRTPADERVIAYMGEVKDLHTAFETRDPGWPSWVRTEGDRLADALGRENPDDLSTSRKIVRLEYKGWALSMVARAFVEKTFTEEEKKRQRIEFATKALQDLDDALAIMADVTYRARQPNHDKATLDVYDWMMGLTAPASDDFKRTHFLKAVSIAVIARNGGNRTKEDVRDELKYLPVQYYRIDHPNNPDLNWALAG